MIMQADEFAEKLDGLMDLVLAHVAGAQDLGLGHSLLAALLPVFEDTILPAHRTKFSQYLLWFLCSQVHHHASPFFPAPLNACSTLAHS